MHKSTGFNMLTHLKYAHTVSSIERRCPGSLEILQNMKTLYEISEIFVRETCQKGHFFSH